MTLKLQVFKPSIDLPIWHSVDCYSVSLFQLIKKVLEILWLSLLFSVSLNSLLFLVDEFWERPPREGGSWHDTEVKQSMLRMGTKSPS